MKLKVLVRNSFHGTEAQISVPADSKIIGPRTAKKLRGKICAADCRCFATHTCFIGQSFAGREIRLIPVALPDGGIQLAE